MGRGHGSSRGSGPGRGISDRTMQGYSRTLAKAIAERENETRLKDVEHLAAFDEKGNMVYSVVGKKNSVAYDTTQTVDKIVTHNHPGGGSFSPEDVVGTIANNEREIRAVSSRGYTYSLKRPAGGWNVDSKTVERDYKRIYNSLKKSDRAYMDSAMWKGMYMTAMPRATRTIGHRTMKILAKQYGWDYSKQKTN